MTATAHEVATALGVTEGTVRGWIRRGQIASVQIGRRRLVVLDSLRQMLARDRHATDAAAGSKGEA